MSPFKIHDIRALDSPKSPAQLSTKVGEMILSSQNVNAKVESVNPETGEYRLVLQGTLNKDAIK
ncbi:MAG TPA: hypothetical protein VFD07_03630 [Candidatus Krumholzibacteria bacterium]|jgi:hypothetical protein|nr:hypothetical protein [Candidatus Krumholzibacteria bacterium]